MKRKEKSLAGPRETNVRKINSLATVAEVIQHPCVEFLHKTKASRSFICLCWFHRYILSTARKRCNQHGQLSPWSIDYSESSLSMNHGLIKSSPY